MPSPTLLEFACMADAAYKAQSPPLVPNWTRISFRNHASGFKGAHYRHGTGTDLVNVIAFAGTDFDGLSGTDPRDLLADAGFAGRGVTAMTFLFNPGAAITIEAGRQLLEWQLRNALDLTRDVMGTSAAGIKTFVVGHSLGGGLSQMVAAELGVKGVAFNAPTTTQLGYTITPPSNFLCVNQYNDPVSVATDMIGDHQGRELAINNGLSGMDAHGMEGIVNYFRTSGGNAQGQQQPF